MTETGSPARRSTRQRAAVNEILGGLAEFRTAQQLHDELRRSGNSIGLTTVYRTLQALADTGDVDMIRKADGEAAYRRCSPVHHHHLVCRSCGAIVDVDCAVGEAPCLNPPDTAGYEIGEAEVIYWGRCPECVAADG